MQSLGICETEPQSLKCTEWVKMIFDMHPGIKPRPKKHQKNEDRTVRVKVRDKMERVRRVSG
jgi:hypothetical protein